MAGPWEKYGGVAPPAAGPWAKYAPAAVVEAQPQLPSLPERGSIIDPIFQGLLGGFADEAGGVVGGAVSTLKGEGFNKGYNDFVDLSRGNLRAYEQRHPIAAAAGEIGGALGTLPITGPMRLVAAPATAGRLTKAGATIVDSLLQGGVYGGVYGAGSAEGGPEQRAQGAAGGVVTGAATGAALGGLMAPLIARARVDPAAIQRAADAANFSVPLTKGQVTGSLSQVAKEEAMRHAAKGEAAANTMRNFDTRQTQAMGNAAENIQSQVAGMSPIIGGSQEAGDLAIAGIRAKAAKTKAASKAQYDIVDRGPPAIISAQGVQQAKQDITQRLLATNFPFDEKLHPAAWNAVSEINNLLTMTPARTLGRTALGGSGLNGLDIKTIEQVRRRMLMTRGTNPDDMKAVSLVRNAFDGWLDGAVDNQLFIGDPAVLDALKEARSKWKDFRAFTSPKPGDDAGIVVKNMVTKDVNGQEVANWLYGSSIVNPPGRSVRVAKRIRDAVGITSDEWNTVRQAAWLRLVQGKNGTAAGPQMIASNINAFVNGRGRPLADVLFSPTELGLMASYGKLARIIVPDVRATNPSKSSYGIARLAQPVVSGLVSALGFTTGGLPGAVAGAALVGPSRDVAGALAARRAVNPKLTQPLFIDPAKIQRLLSPEIRAMIPFVANHKVLPPMIAGSQPAVAQDQQ